MSKLEIHLERARAYRQESHRLKDPGSLVELWFLSTYHFIEACAAKHRLHIQKHQRVPDELRRNLRIFESNSARIIDAFQYLDFTARAKFVYVSSGTKADFERARQCFETIEAICEEVLG